MDISDSVHQKMLQDLIKAAKENVINPNEKLIEKAFSLSYEAHKNDFRASGEPYFYHPYQVAVVVATEIPIDDISIAAALLHDVIEDTEFKLDFIEKEFGKEVAEIVDGVTKIGGVFRGHEIGQAENYRKLLLSMVKDVRVILVKFADRLHNMRTLDYLSQYQQRKIAKETLEIYAPFTHRFGLGRVKWELEDLAFKYLNKDAYDEIARKINAKRREREAYIAKFIKPVTESLGEYKLDFEIVGRAKHLYSIYKKMIQQNKPFEEIYDLLAVRIVLNSKSANDCYLALGIINQVYKPIPDRFKDYISIPKKNNYQSIHNTVIGPEGKLVEVQIRTRSMHEVAEKGVAAHWKYKENKSSSDRELEEWVNWVRDIFENVSKDEATKELLASFKLNLYQEEIYVFTPQGDLKRLPIASTPIDFAFEIHSRVGMNCIGAKVNGKIVPLDTKLNSGDQVEILTSKNQHPNKSWLQFVKTHKAKSHIRKYLNAEDEKAVDAGKSIFEKKIKKNKLSFNSDDIAGLAKKLKFDNSNQFFKAVSEDKIDLDAVLAPEEKKEVKDDVQISQTDTFLQSARSTRGGIVFEGNEKGLEYSYAKCCNPIPGDFIIGYITVGEGIKIHRRNCKNLINLLRQGDARLVQADWFGMSDSTFLAGIHLRGEDMPGMLTEITAAITKYENTNIKAINLNSNNSFFEGTITVFVKNIDHLNTLMARIKKMKGIHIVERFDPGV